MSGKLTQWLIFLASEGKRFRVDDPVVFELEKLIDDTLANMALISLPDFLPWLSLLLPMALQKRLFSLDIIDTMRDRFSKFCVVSVACVSLRISLHGCVITCWYIMGCSFTL